MDKVLEGFVVISRRKSDGAVFFTGSGNRRMNNYVFETLEEAVKEAERKARECSPDYTYFAYALVAVAEAKRAEPPVEISYF